MGLSAQEANRIIQNIKNVCQDHGLWLTIESEHRPDLKFVRCNISIMVDSDKECEGDKGKKMK